MKILLILSVIFVQSVFALDDFCMYRMESKGMPGYVSYKSKIACSDGERYETQNRTGLVLVIPLPAKKNVKKDIKKFFTDMKFIEAANIDVNINLSNKTLRKKVSISIFTEDYNSGDFSKYCLVHRSNFESLGVYKKKVVTDYAVNCTHEESFFVRSSTQEEFITHMETDKRYEFVNEIESHNSDEDKAWYDPSARAYPGKIKGRLLFRK